MFSKLWLKDAAERAIKTFAQSALATLGLGATDILSTDWVGVLSVGGGAAVVSVLTSLLSASREETVSPASLVEQPYGRHAKDDGPVPPPDGPTHDPHRRPVI
jgi:hypothetical protein